MPCNAIRLAPAIPESIVSALLEGSGQPAAAPIDVFAMVWCCGLRRVHRPGPGIELVGVELRYDVTQERAAQIKLLAIGIAEWAVIWSGYAVTTELVSSIARALIRCDEVRAYAPSDPAAPSVPTDQSAPLSLDPSAIPSPAPA
jgi:hypothetical protein